MGSGSYYWYRKQTKEWWAVIRVIGDYEKYRMGPFKTESEARNAIKNSTYRKRFYHRRKNDLFTAVSDEQFGYNLTAMRNYNLMMFGKAVPNYKSAYDVPEDVFYTNTKFPLHGTRIA